VLATRYVIVDPRDNSHFILAAYADGSVGRIPVHAAPDATGTRDNTGQALPWRAMNPKMPEDNVLTPDDDGAPQNQPNRGNRERAWLR
jgi:hypothetical protein